MREQIDEYLSLLSDLGKGAGWVAAAAALALSGGKRDRRAAVACTAAMFTAVGLAQGPIKNLVRRRRPWATRAVRVVGATTPDFSFPSGHTAGSFAAATALAAFYPERTPLLVTIAALVGYSRVYLGHHHPTDVIAGAGLGSGVGLALGGLLKTRAGEPVDRLAAELPRMPAGPDDDPAGTDGAPGAVPDGGGALVEAEQDGAR
jgi:undecaprenyl-diphosphatase